MDVSEIKRLTEAHTKYSAHVSLSYSDVILT